MKKAGKILSIIGAIMAILMLVAFVGDTLFLALLLLPASFVASIITGAFAFIQFSDTGGIQFTYQGIINGTSAEYIMLGIILFVVFLVLLGFVVAQIVGEIMVLVLIILTFKGQSDKSKKGTCIAAIVFDVLYLILGGSGVFIMFITSNILYSVITLCMFYLSFILILVGQILTLIAKKKEEKQLAAYSDKVVSVQ